MPPGNILSIWAMSPTTDRPQPISSSLVSSLSYYSSILAHIPGHQSQTLTGGKLGQDSKAQFPGLPSKWLLISMLHSLAISIVRQLRSIDHFMLAILTAKPHTGRAH